MKIFGPMYERALLWAKHPRAPWLLTGLSFIEAIFFPVPPETMLAPMSLAQPRRAFRFASLSLLGSMLGMFIGYAIGQNNDNDRHYGGYGYRRPYYNHGRRSWRR